MYKNNVLDFKQFKEDKVSREKGQQKAVSEERVSPEANLIDMTERRQEILSEERRRVKRTILTEFISAYIVVPKRGLQNVSLYDISEHGLAFDLELDSGSFKVNEEIAMRVYLNHQTYFPFIVKVANSRSLELEGVNRLGVNFVKNTVNDVALGHFVNFIETVSASLKNDSGDVLVTNLKE